MTSGVELLLRASVMPDADIALVFRHGTSNDTDEAERAALVAALLSSFTAADAPLIRELTRQEIAVVRDAASGCGDVLLATDGCAEGSGTAMARRRVISSAGAQRPSGEPSGVVVR